MRSFWKREQGLEAELRAFRPEPRDELVRTLAARVPDRSRRTGALRSVAAVGLTVAMLGSVAGFGGVGYAAAPAKQVAKVVKKVFVPRGVEVVEKTSAADQYRPPGARPTTRPKAKKAKKGRVAGVQGRARPSFTG